MPWKWNNNYTAIVTKKKRGNIRHWFCQRNIHKLQSYYRWIEVFQRRKHKYQNFTVQKQNKYIQITTSATSINKRIGRKEKKATDIQRDWGNKPGDTWTFLICAALRILENLLSAVFCNLEKKRILGMKSKTTWQIRAESLAEERFPWSIQCWGESSRVHLQAVLCYIDGPVPEQNSNCFSYQKQLMACDTTDHITYYQ